MTQTANELLMGSGVKSCKFDTLGMTWIGTIVDEPRVTQCTKYQSTELAFWPSGDPMMQIVVPIQTTQRDPSDANDDGRRHLFIQPRMFIPLRDAIAKGGAKGLAVGGRIACRWVDGSGQGEGNAKIYVFEYAPPVVEVGSMLAPAAPTPATVAAPVQAQPMLAPPAAPTPAPAQAASMLAPAVPAQPSPTMTSMLAAPSPADRACPAGMDAKLWATLPAEQQDTILAAMAFGAPF